MNDLHTLIDTQLALVRQRLNRNVLTIVETGTIRADSEGHAAGDGWSTVAFARQVQDHGGWLISVDLDTTVAATVLDRYGIAGHVDLITGHSVDVLSRLLNEGLHCDVAYLDSDNDAQLILHEYLIARRLVRSGGLIMIDDVDLDSTTVVKGHLVVPWLLRERVTHTIHPRAGGGHRTGVLAVNV